ncbi:MAG TPA: PilT/PilU family type 4a pilus ATPase [Polyangiales bacterium]|jgi:twitching motility protein PilT|nr:PilT/PilU family type 4a pilus ATPase [Polyangiales bacterium]
MDEQTFHELLVRGARYQASDALFKVGQPPAFRVTGSLHYLQGERLRPEHTMALAAIVLRQSRYHGDLQDLTEYDTAYDVPGVGRYRVNVYRQRGTFALALRSIPLQIPTFEQLGVPQPASMLAELERGLVLVVGAAGNGKSSTLASMIGHINANRRAHVVTLEDPIEFLHQDQLATICQREIGLDTPDFSKALRSVLRQDPDVILLGEIRDESTMDVALKAAETGHLVLSTLHTPDVSRTIGRILALSGSSDLSETRERLADNLKGVLAQRLLPGIDGERRVLAAEVLVATGTARESIRKPDKNPTLKEVMERGAHPYGMQTFEMAIRKLVTEERISVEVARQALD